MREEVDRLQEVQRQIMKLGKVRRVVRNYSS